MNHIEPSKVIRPSFYRECMATIAQLATLRSKWSAL